MEYAYRADAWQALYTALASASAALTGLLFIALSLNLRVIVKNPAHTARARETFGVTLSLLVLSVLVLIPGQDRRFLGAELLVGSLMLAFISVRLNLQTLSKIVSERRGRWILRLIPLHLGTLSIITAGISLIFGQFGGLFWLIPTVIIYLLWSLNNAWLLIIQTAKEEL